MTSKERCEALMEYIVEENQGYFDKERIGNDLIAILEDLEKLEQYEAIFKEPLKDIRERLEILEILKECEDDKHSLYCVNVLNALSSGKITQDDVIKVKEWLEKSDN